MNSASGANENYWQECGPLQKVKHRIIKEYLNGWFPKLGYWSGRVIYIDTHAGRGKHLSGHLGSPLVALHALLNHKARDELLKKSEFVFWFIERNKSNFEVLKQELQAVQGKIPPGVIIHPQHGDSFNVLQDAVRSLKDAGKALAPAFIFVDPFGFKIPGAVLRELMSFGRVELFVTIMWRELDMAIAQIRQGAASRLERTLDSVFDGPEWRDVVNARTADERAEQAVVLLRQKYGARWATYVRMLGKNNATRYFLLHLTRHPDGRDLMKSCIWKVCPGFYARAKDDPRQQWLIRPEPDWDEIEKWVLQQLRSGPKHWCDLIEAVREEIWTTVHLNNVIRTLLRERAIIAKEHSGRPGPTSNPLLELD